MDVKKSSSMYVALSISPISSLKNFNFLINNIFINNINMYY